MNKTLEMIMDSREDISDYVFHFTKGANAKDTLIKIINDNAVVDIGNNGYICFTEAPLLLLPPMFDIFEGYHNPMYTPYGIGIKKEALYNMGGRPVIYGDENDLFMLPKEMRWRYVKYVPKVYDFSWLREWRVPCNKVELDFDNSFLVVKTNNDIDGFEDITMDVSDIDIDAQPEDGGILTEYFFYIERKYKIISVERLNDYNLEKKQRLDEELSKQNKEESHYYTQWE